MLRLNINCKLLIKIHKGDLNTIHVKVKLQTYIQIENMNYNLNTIHVKVKPKQISHSLNNINLAKADIEPFLKKVPIDHKEFFYM